MRETRIVGACRKGLAVRLRRSAWVLAVGLGMLGAASGEAAVAGFQCAAAEIRGVPAADAQTAVEMVCEAIRLRSGGTGTYGVSLRSLGRQLVLTANRDGVATVSLQLEGVEEVATSATRVAEALVAGRSLESTQRIDNLLETETRAPLTKKGSVKFSLGVGAVSPLGHGGSGAGFSVGLTYAASSLALPVDLRFGWNNGTGSDPDASFVALSAGARHYTSRRDVSPFLGAGLSMLSLNASEAHGWEDDRFHGSRFGGAPYLEAGVEVARLHRAHLTFLARADFPTGSVRSEELTIHDWDPTSRTSGAQRTIPRSRGTSCP